MDLEDIISKKMPLATLENGLQYHEKNVFSSSHSAEKTLIEPVWIGYSLQEFYMQMLVV